MIGVPRKDGGSAKQLLHQHGACEKVRPGGLAEGEQQVGFVALGLAVPIGGTEDEATFTDAAITPCFQLRGELYRRHVTTLLVEQHSAERQLRLWDPSAGFRQFGQPYWPGDALFIARDQLGLGRSRNLAASYNVEKNEGLPARSGAAGGRLRTLVAKSPHPFEVIEAADFGAEQVHYHVTGVDQHPVGGGKALDTR